MFPPMDERSADRAHQVEQEFTDGGWFRCRKDILRAFKPNVAILINFLLNESNRKRAVAENGGWFRLATSRVCMELGYANRKQHERTFKTLIDLRIVEFVMDGNPAKRWIKVNHDRFSMLLAKGLRIFSKSDWIKRLPKNGR